MLIFNFQLDTSNPEAKAKAKVGAELLASKSKFTVINWHLWHPDLIDASFDEILDAFGALPSTSPQSDPDLVMGVIMLREIPASHSADPGTPCDGTTGTLRTWADWHRSKQIQIRADRSRSRSRSRRSSPRHTPGRSGSRSRSPRERRIESVSPPRARSSFHEASFSSFSLSSLVSSLRGLHTFGESGAHGSYSSALLSTLRADLLPVFESVISRGRENTGYHYEYAFDSGTAQYQRQQLQTRVVDFSWGITNSY
jgi:hypothetical protein